MIAENYLGSYQYLTDLTFGSIEIYNENSWRSKYKTGLCPWNLILPSQSSQVTQVTFYELCSQAVSGVDLKALLGESDYSEPHLREADTFTFYRSSYLDRQSNLHCMKTGDRKDQMLLLSKSVICYLFLHYLINFIIQNRPNIWRSKIATFTKSYTVRVLGMLKF